MPGTASSPGMCRWENTFCLGDFPVLAVEPFYDVGGIHDPADIIWELEEGADIFTIVFPVTDSVRVYLSPCVAQQTKVPISRTKTSN